MASNKGLIAVLLLLVLFLPLFAVPVAAEEQKISDTLYTTLSSVFGFMDQIEIALIGEQGDAADKATFWARFLIWILVFTLCYYIFRMFLPGSIAGTLGFVLALISVLGIPGTLLRDIIINYSLIATLILLGGPIVGLLLFRFRMKSQHGGSVWTHVGFVFLDILLIILIPRFISGLDKLTEQSQAAGSVTFWAWFLWIFVLILLVFDIIDVFRSARGSYNAPFMPSWVPGAAGTRDLAGRAERATADAERLARVGTQLNTIQQELESINARIAAGEVTLASQRLAIQQRLNRVLQDLENLEQQLL